MTSDFGSIDDLLNSGPQASLANPAQVEAGAKIARTIWAAGAEAWGVLLNRGVMYSDGATDLSDPANVLAAEAGPALVTRIAWSGDRSGKLYLVMPEAGAKAVVAYMMALMMGTDANPDTQAMDAEGLDAYTEAVSQFIGSSAQALRQDPGGSVTLTPEKTTVVNLETDSFDPDMADWQALCAVGQLTIEGSSPVAVYTLLAPELSGVTSLAERSQKADDAFVEKAVTTTTQDKKGDDYGRIRALRLPVKVILAERTMRMADLINLNPGSIIEFRKSSDEMLDLEAGNVPLAQGEVVITREHFGLQIRSLRAGAKKEAERKVTYV